MEKALTNGVARGFRAFKIGWGLLDGVNAETDRKMIKSAREVVGDEVELMVDAGGSDAFWQHGYKWAINTAKMLAEYDVTWFEEPLRPDDIEGYKRLTEHAPLPIAGCEVLTRRQAFVPWIEQHAVDYIQPDVTKVGGIRRTSHCGLGGRPLDSLCPAWMEYGCGACGRSAVGGCCEKREMGRVSRTFMLHR